MEPDLVSTAVTARQQLLMTLLQRMDTEQAAAVAELLSEGTATKAELPASTGTVVDVSA